jgi:hypothetical protein
MTSPSPLVSVFLAGRLKVLPGGSATEKAFKFGGQAVALQRRLIGREIGPREIGERDSASGDHHPRCAAGAL